MARSKQLLHNGNKIRMTRAYQANLDDVTEVVANACYDGVRKYNSKVRFNRKNKFSTCSGATWALDYPRTLNVAAGNRYDAVKQPINAKQMVEDVDDMNNEKKYDAGVEIANKMADLGVFYQGGDMLINFPYSIVYSGDENENDGIAARLNEIDGPEDRPFDIINFLQCLADGSDGANGYGLKVYLDGNEVEYNLSADLGSDDKEITIDTDGLVYQVYGSTLGGGAWSWTFDCSLDSYNSLTIEVSHTAPQR